MRCVRRTSPLAVWRELRDADALIFGGGTLLQDSTSLRSLLYYTALLKLAHRKGLRTELWANGLEMPRSWLGERMIRSVLRDCSFLGLRDGRSVRLARELLGARTEIALIRQSDLALATMPCEEERLRFLQEHYGLCNTTEGYVIAVLRGSAPKGYAGAFAQWLGTLRSEGFLLLFIPMLPKEDLSASLQMARELGGTVACGLGASDVVGLASKARLVCGMRLHALVFAAAAGTPFVGFGGDPKIESFCRENGGVYFTDLYH